MKKPGRILLFLVMIFPLLCYVQSDAAPEDPAKPSQRFITIDFENVDINLFIKYISELTGKNFIIDKTVKGNVTIISPTKISEDEAYRVFESVLDVHGFTTVEAGAVIKIIPAVKARSENIRTFRSNIAGYPEDKIVTQLIPLKHTTPGEIKKVLAPLVSKTSVVIAHTQSGMLIVTETLSNINRLLAIIDAIDIAYTGEEIVVVPLEYASATTVSKVLNSLFGRSGAVPKGAKKASKIRVVPYDRINALIVVATPSDVERVKKLAKVLDSEMRKDSGNIHVFYLQNATASEMAKVLNFLPGKQQTGKDSKGKAPAISKDVKIMADEETNALIINASRSEFNVLKGVIEKLDIPRRMVYLEALIMEVNTTKDFDVGVEWAMGGKFSDGTGTAVMGFSDKNYSLLGGVGEASPPITSPSGFALGVLKQGIQIAGITFPNIGAVLNAYKNDSDINIISTPQLLTTDNKEAAISVGENIPYITSQNTTSGDQDYTNYEYRDVSTKLTITPHINQADTLRLEISTEVVKLKSSSLTPETFKRTVKTTVIVKDNQTIVIGGIIGEDSSDSSTRVPLLGDIPFIGWLFRSDSTNSRQTNMFIFITPHIIKNPADIAAVTLAKEGQLGKVMPQVKEELYKDINISHALRLVEMGYDKMKSGFRSDAKEYFLGALDIDPGNPYAHFNLGVIYEEEGNKGMAIESYQKVIMTGTAATAMDSTDPETVGAPLVQLSKERIVRMRRMETKDEEFFQGNEEK